MANQSLLHRVLSLIRFYCFSGSLVPALPVHYPPPDSVHSSQIHNVHWEASMKFLNYFSLLLILSKLYSLFSCVRKDLTSFTFQQDLVFALTISLSPSQLNSLFLSFSKEIMKSKLIRNKYSFHYYIWLFHGVISAINC